MLPLIGPILDPFFSQLVDLLEIAFLAPSNTSLRLPHDCAVIARLFVSGTVADPIRQSAASSDQATPTENATRLVIAAASR
jgi:hypothetical protein